MYKLALAILTAATMALAGSASAQEDTPFALDWKFEGPSAPYFAAIDNGHFEAAGLNVEISAGQGSLDAIPKVATGAFPDRLRGHQFSGQVSGPESRCTGHRGHDDL